MSIGYSYRVTEFMPKPIKGKCIQIQLEELLNVYGEGGFQLLTKINVKKLSYYQNLFLIFEKKETFNI